MLILGEIRVGVLKGPTGMGAIKLMDDSENGVYPNYHFTLTPEVTDIVARLSNGDLDIGALPTNVASNLYNKTSGAVKIIAVNCLGVLYILENGDSVHSVADLKGRTIYCNGQGANPEYTLNYILTQNGLVPGEDVNVEFGDPSEIAAKMISGDIDLCMLPVPVVTTVCLKNADVRKALDVSAEFAAAANDGSKLTMGCLVAKSDFIDAHPDAVAAFLENYHASIAEVLDDVDTSAELIAKYEIAGNAAIAKLAVPDASIVCITYFFLLPGIRRKTPAGKETILWAISELQSRISMSSTFAVPCQTIKVFGKRNGLKPAFTRGWSFIAVKNAENVLLNISPPKMPGIRWRQRDTCI